MNIYPAELYPASYWAYAFMISGGFYGAVSWFGNRHLSDSAKDTLTQWLQGKYESTWTRQFGTLFDAVFGERHFTWHCFWRSSLVSVTTVTLLYVLFTQVLGIIAVRANDDLPILQVLLVGATINIIPDFLSLWETRWLLKKFENVRSFWGQFILLFADAVFSGLTIWGGISLFRVWHGDALLSATELIAMFSVYALFFYSTFITSLWAWVYCLSTWIMRLVSRSFLKKLLDVEKKPVAQVALVGSVFVFMFAFALTPALSIPEGENVTGFDRWLCKNVSDEVCKHVIRLTPDEEHDLNMLTQACEGGGIEHCVTSAEQYFQGFKEIAFKLLKKACDGRKAQGCSYLGIFYRDGLGVEQNTAKAVELFRQACDNRNMQGCAFLGLMFQEGNGVKQDYTEAIKLYHQACDGKFMLSCGRLALMYEVGLGVELNEVKAFDLHRQACDGGHALSCGRLALMYKFGKGIMRDAATAVFLLQRACYGGDMASCSGLGYMYQRGNDVKQDYTKAVGFYRQACDGKFTISCASLGLMYLAGEGVKQDTAKALPLFKQSCDDGLAIACDVLKKLTEIN